MSPDAFEDPIALLLPDAGAEDIELARALSGAMRIFSSDASDSGSMSVRVQVGSARTELDIYHEGSVGHLLQDLAIHAASGAVRRESFLRLPRPRSTYAEAWRSVFGVMTEAERQDLGVAVPEPGESSLSVLERLVDALERHAIHATRDSELMLTSARHWRIRQEWFGRPEATGEAAASLEAILGELARRRGARVRGLRSAVLGDLAALALDRGRTREALEFVRRAGTSAIRIEDATSPMHVLGASLRWLDGGDDELPELEPALARCCAEAPLPEVWEELMGLCGRDAPTANDRRAVGACVRLGRALPPSRGDLGASAVVVSILRPDGSFQVVHHDVAPGLVGALDGWTARHRLAVAERGAPEHEALRAARTHVRLRVVERPQDVVDIGRYCLAGRSQENAGETEVMEPAAIVVEPLLDEAGEPIGLVWIELPTRWLPARSQRQELASRLARSELVQDARSSIPGSRRASSVHAGSSETAGPRPRLTQEISQVLYGSPAEDLAEAWARAVEGLQLKTAERRWIGFHVALDPRTEQEGTLTGVALGGGASDRLAEPDLEGAWAVRRSLRLGGPIRYTLESAEGRPRPVMLHGGAATGAALPVLRDGRVVGILSLESARRGDARESDLSRWFEALQAASPRLEAAALSDLDRRSSDGGWAVDAEEPGFASELSRLRSVGRASCDVLVTGEAGAGRRTLARMIHHVGTLDGMSGDLLTRTAFGLEAFEIEGWGKSPSLRTVVIADLEWLSESAQAALLRLGSLPTSLRPRILATAGGARGDFVESASGARPAVQRDVQQVDGSQDGGLSRGTLHPGLATLLQRVTLARPALRRTRHRLPALVRFLQRRIAYREDCMQSPPLGDDALALLWRQTWPENAATLEAVLYSLHLRGEDMGGSHAPCGPADVAEAIVESGLDLIRRLPSRQPDRGDLLSALWVTRTATQRLNKTRAALYLGWDPNTLAARLKDAGVSTLEDVAGGLGMRESSPALGS